ncbi:MAG: hypothetical protein KC419_14910 [Anaerolineales bacterium]|nr:hypothetical protein [Anaerolineales bacterium]MCA9929774.1 hypothetical protein [Anaerolineales bacterium]
MQKWLMYVVSSLLFLWTLVACSPQTDTQSESAANNIEINSEVAAESALQPVTPAADESGTASGTKEVNVASDGQDAVAGAKEENATSSQAAQLEGDNAVLIYQRQGGLKGIGPSSQEWRFYEDGRIVGSDGASWQVDPEAVADLVAEITASGFQNLEKSYIPEDTCCDRATHIITMQTADKMFTVETLDAADMPQALEDDLQKINNFLMALYE